MVTMNKRNAEGEEMSWASGSASDDEKSLSSGDDSLTSESGSNASGDGKKKMVWKQSKAVRRSKIGVFTGIILAAIVGGFLTGVLVSREELSNFDMQFESFAKEIGSISVLNAKQAFSIIHSFSRTVTVASQSSTDNFPFFTMPYFAAQGEEAQAISGAQVILYAPIVNASEKVLWEEYSVANQGWIKEGLDYQGLADIDPGFIPQAIYAFDSELHGEHEDDHEDEGHEDEHKGEDEDEDEHAAFIQVDSHEADEHESHEEGEVHVEGYYLPVWQMANAPTNAAIVNLDLLTHTSFEHTMVDVLEQREGILSYVSDFHYITGHSIEEEEADQHIQSYILEPVFETLEGNAKIVGFIVAIFPWANYFKNVLPAETEGVHVVIDDHCGDTFTFEINGAESILLGSGDLHDPAYDRNKYSVEFATFEHFEGSHPDTNGVSYDERFGDTNNGHCRYVLDMYPSAKLEAMYTSNKHFIYAAVVVGIFAAILVLLVIYDRTVINRQKRLLDGANRIISSLFPKSVQKRLMDEAAGGGKQIDERKGLLNDPTGTDFGTRPIADLFPNTTIIFADIVGFTAWSSTREPTQVFTLLETIYQAFDEAAKQRRVFKVETIGDCYVAVTGLPDPRKDHAVVMSRFARECVSKFGVLVKQMEETLGPDTGELGLRVGLHSGPVTAGVLRGDKARFQLFGDTMNTTARMESNGARNKIHVSEATADLLIAAGKPHWLRQREDKIIAKGKGEMTTFWLEQKGSGMTSSSGRSSCASSDLDGSGRGSKEAGAGTDAFAGLPVDIKVNGVTHGLTEKTQRLVKWNTENLARILKVVVARRMDQGVQPTHPSKLQRLEEGRHGAGQQDQKMVADEVVEIIEIPKCNTGIGTNPATDPDSVELSVETLSQLESYVQTIAAMYPGNPFHNFEHASHVCMSVQKLLARIVAPEADHNGKVQEASTLHDHTYGITSDPLLQFCVVLAALIHDVDHPGVPNSTLVAENTSLAAVYKNKSVAEQNSVDLAWDLLMDENFVDLRRALYTTEEDFKRTRQLVVNSVMATDIMDKQLGAFRKARWAKAFDESNIRSPEQSDADKVDRKATIVLEHLIQASDVAHTMQHWQVFVKWNERLFNEMYRAFKDGRAEKDPSIDWYKSELGFFDFYIIPLAKKLESCGVFGVSSAEYLDYAMQNRREWELKGEETVVRYVENYSS